MSYAAHSPLLPPATRQAVDQPLPRIWSRDENEVVDVDPVSFAGCVAIRGILQTVGIESRDGMGLRVLDKKPLITQLGKELRRRSYRIFPVALLDLHQQGGLVPLQQLPRPTQGGQFMPLHVDLDEPDPGQIDVIESQQGNTQALRPRSKGVLDRAVSIDHLAI